MSSAPIAGAFRLDASSMAGAISPEPKRSRSIRWSSNALRACTRRLSSTESLARCAMLRQTIGVAWSSSALLARDHSGRWTICCSRQTTVRVLSASVSMKSRRHRCASSTRPWTWRSFNPSPLQSSRTTTQCAVRKPSRCKSSCSAAHRWVARVPRLWSRMTKGYGSPSSTGPATVGIVRVSSMLCSASPRHAISRQPIARWSPSRDAMCFW